MTNRRVLIMYAPTDSGHHQAALAIERAVVLTDPTARVKTLDSLNYTNPVLEKVIIKTYLGMLKTTPELWDYLYDNPKILRKSERLRELIHKFNSAKLKTFIDNFRPDVVVCTQAFPCGVMADYKRINKVDFPLVGILTDYLPHSYWVYDRVDTYFVHSDDAREKLMRGGVDGRKIRTSGIPIDPKFKDELDTSKIIEKLGLDRAVPTILVMGGGQGMGPIKRVVGLLDKLGIALQILVVAGKNKSLKSQLQRRQPRFKKRVSVLGYVNNVDELMGISSLIITKPGGITTAEAMAKALPIVIIDPIPGQEAKNTQYLLKVGAAIEADDEVHLARSVEELLKSPSRLSQMRARASECGRPDAALRVAEFILKL